MIKLMTPWVGKDELELVAQVIESGHLVDGPMTREFERLVAHTAGATHAVACTSATTGMELALRAFGIGPGDEVVVPDFTHPATALAVYNVGAEPVLVDVELSTFNSSVEQIEPALTPRTKAVIPVSWGGQPLRIDEIIELCRPCGVKIIEDAACSLGASLKGIPVGKLADCTVFSFHPRKIFATGDGGCIATNDQDLAKLLISLKTFGAQKIDAETRFVRHGTNSRFSSILAAVGVGQLRRLDEILDDRIKRAERYFGLLEGVKGIRLPFVEPGARHIFQSFCVFFEESRLRDKILHSMREAGVEVQIGTFALHREPVFQNTTRSGGLANSARLADQLMALPLHHELSASDQEQVCSTLASYLA